MFTGKVKWFNQKKGYGFIAPDNGDKDIFVHISEVQKAGIRNLQENDVVTYEVEDNRGKKAAIDLKLVS